MTVDSWFQMHIKLSNEALSGRFSGETEGPFNWQQVLVRTQQILDAKMNWQMQIAHYAEVTEVAVGSGALYQYSRLGWEKVREIPALENLPSYIGHLPRVDSERHGKLLFRFCNSDRDIAVKQFVDEGIDLDWVLATTALDRVLVFDATLKPVTIIGADPTRICENSGYPGFKEPSLIGPPDRLEITPAAETPGLPIAGFRCWRLCVPSKIVDGQIVDDEPKLYGPNYGLPYVGLYEWTEAEKQADCMYFGRHSLAEKCECGLYSFHELDADALKAYYCYSKLSIETGVRGAVLGTGGVLVHNDGWRSESARIIGFVGDDVPPRFLTALQKIAQKFDVPILPERDLISLAQRKGRVLRKSDLEYLG